MDRPISTQKGPAVVNAASEVLVYKGAAFRIHACVELSDIPFRMICVATRQRHFPQEHGAAEQARLRSAGGAMPDNRSGLTVLVVSADSNWSVRMIGCLRDAGFNTLNVPPDDDLADIAAALAPRLLICELQGPEMNEIAVAKRILAGTPECRFLFICSNRDAVGRVREYRLAGWPFDSLRRPICLQDLLIRVGSPHHSELAARGG